MFRAYEVIYADFECFIDEDGTHEPSGFATYRVTSYGTTFQPFVYSGPDRMEHFFEHLEEEREVIEGVLKMNVPMIDLTTRN